MPHTTWVGPESPTGPDILEGLKDRRILYTPAVLLLLFTVAFFGWHLQQVQITRDDARANFNQTRRYKERGDSGSGSMLAANGSTVNSSIIRNQVHKELSPSAPPAPYEEPLLPASEKGANSLQLVPTHSSRYYDQNTQNLNTSQNITQAQDGSEYGSDTSYHQRQQRHGTYKLHDEGCVTCDVIREGTSFRSKMTGKNYTFMSSVSCTDENCIYLVSNVVLSTKFCLFWVILPISWLDYTNTFLFPN